MAADIGCGNVVEEYLIGNTRIKICDDCCRNVTEQEIEGILNRIAARVAEQLASTAAAKKTKDKSSSSYD